MSQRVSSFSTRRISRSASKRNRSRFFRPLVESLEERRLLAFDVEPNGTFGTALVLSGTSGQAQGYIGNNPDQPAPDVDMYEVSLNQGDLISFGGADVHGGGSVRLRVFDSAGTEVGGANYEQGGVSYWNTFYAKQAGTYYVGLSGNGVFTGSYTLTYSITHLTVDETEPNDVLGAANSVPVSVGAPTTIRGFLGNGANAADRDDYTFFMPAGTTLTVKQAAHPQGTPFNATDYQLLDGSGTVLAAASWNAQQLTYTSFVGRQVYVQYNNNLGGFAYQLTFTLNAFAAPLDVEPNGTFGTALVLSGTSGQAQGYIGNNPDQPVPDVDMYEVSLNQGDLISFGGADAHGWQNVRLRVFDSAGTDVGGSGFEQGGVSYWNTFYAKQAGTYYVGLSGNGAWTGSYTLTYSITNLAVDEVESNDVIADANPVDVAIGSPAILSGFLGNGPAAADQDDYTFFMPAGTTLTVNQASHPQGTPFNATAFRLVDGSGTVLAQNPYYAPLSFTSFVGRQVYVEYSNNLGGFAYQLTFTLDAFSGTVDAEPNGTLATALPLTGGQVEGYVGNAPSEAPDVDMYEVSLNQGDLISFGGADAHGWQNVRLRVFDSAGTDVGGSGFEQGGVSYWNTFYAKQAGTYYVGLSGNGAWTGSYTLTYSITNLAVDETEPNDVLGAANSVPISVGNPVTVRGFLGNGANAADQDDYTFFMPAGTTLTVMQAAHPQGTPFNATDYQLLDGSGTVLAVASWSAQQLTYTSFIGRQVYVQYNNNLGGFAYQLTFALDASNVNPNAPLVSAIPDQEIDEDTATAALSFTVQDAITSPENLAITINSSNTALLPVANIALNGAGSARTLTAAPLLNQYGLAKVSVTVTDTDQNSTTNVFVVIVNPVNDPPVANGAYMPSFDEDTSLSRVLTGFDADGDTLTFAVSSAPAHGTVILDPSGAFTYTPDANYHGPDSFQFTVSDGQATSAAAPVYLLVDSVNDAPVAVGDTAVTDEDTPLTLSQVALKGNDTDVDNTNSQLIVTAVSGASHGTVALNADGTITFTPDENFYGTAGFDYTVSDGSWTDTGHVTVTVNDVSDAPTGLQLNLSANSINENHSVELSGSFVDVDLVDAYAVTIDWGDGSANTVLNLGAGILAIPATSHQYLDDYPTGTPQDNYLIQVTVSDSAGGIATGSGTIIVHNVAPMIHFGPNPATLDGSFGNGGIVTTDVPGPSFEHAAGVVSFADGKFVALGFQATWSGGGFILVGYNSDGSLDKDFGDEGVVSGQSSYFGQQFSPRSIVRYSNDTFLLVGQIYNGQDSDFAVVRYFANGTIDASFGVNGLAQVDIEGWNDDAVAAVIQTISGQNKIVVVGRNVVPWQDAVPGHTDFAAIRLDASGALDVSFGVSQGRLIYGAPTLQFDGTDVALAPDNKIVLGGSFNDGATNNYDFAALRLTENGLPDPGFNNTGADGLVLADLGSDNEFANSVAVMADGKVVIAGSSNQQFAIARFNTDGSPDTTFGDPDAPLAHQGQVLTTFDGGASASDMLLQSDGKLILAGSIYSTTLSRNVFALARYELDGDLDGSFGEGGLATADFNNYLSSAIAMTVGPAGAIVTAGITMALAVPPDIALARFIAQGANPLVEGTLDSTFGDAGLVVTGLTGATLVSPVDSPVVAVQADGKVVVAGAVQAIAASPAIGLVRYNANGALDTEFGVNGTIYTSLPGNPFTRVIGVHIQSDQSILVTGMLQGTDFELAAVRYLGDGSLDHTYGTDGMARIPFAPGFLDVYDTALDADDRLVATGRKIGASGDDFLVVRLLSSGSLDPDFGTDGQVITDFNGDYNVATTIAIQPDQKILIAGVTSGSLGVAVTLVRYLANGELDTDYGANGFVTTTISTAPDGVRQLIVKPDGKALTINTASTGGFSISRFNENGTLDGSFGAAGTTVVNTEFFSQAINAALQADGKILVSGIVYGPSGPEPIVARLDANGSLDTSFGDAGLQLVSFGSVQNSGSALAVLPDGGFVVAGSALDSVGSFTTDFAVARFVGDVLPETTTQVGATYELTVAFDDAGIVDTHTATIDWGDGSPIENVSVTPAPGGGSFFGSHVFRSSDQFTVTVTVTDDDLGTTSEALMVTVENVAPTITDLWLSETAINEGFSVAASGFFTDPGLAFMTETFTGTAVWNDGVVTPVNISGGLFTTTRTFDDDNPSGTASDTFTVSITISDNAGGTSSAVVSPVVTVSNVAPWIPIFFPGPSLIDEGQSATVGGLFLDAVRFASTETFTGIATWSDGITTPVSISIEDSVGYFFTTRYFPDDNSPDNTYTVTFTISDDDLGSVTVELTTITVNNVAPTATLAGNATAVEGAIYRAYLTATDPGEDTISSSRIEWGDGQWTGYVNGLPPNGLAHAYQNPGTYTITASVTDEDGIWQAVNMIEVVVTDAPPSVNAGADATLDEGAAFTGAGSVVKPLFAQPGFFDTYTATVNYGDGSATQPLSLNANGSFSLQHTYTDDGVYVVTVTVTDDDGTSASDTLNVSVTNVAPSVATDHVARVVNEGATATNWGTWSDAGNDVVSLSASIGTVTKNANGTWNWSFNTNDGPDESQVVTITATDSDGAASTTTFGLTVNNVVPIITSVLSNHDDISTVSLSGQVTLQGSFTDPGLDTHVVTVNWGDGTTGNVSVNQLADSFAGSHTYATGGIFKITVIVTDSDGAVSQIATTQAVVAGVGIVDGTLYVIGTNGQDVIDLKAKKGNKNKPAELTVTAKLDKSGNTISLKQTYDPSIIQGIVSLLGDGDDDYNGSSAGDAGIPLAQIVLGGTGNDRLQGGSGRDLLLGGAGDDDISGGDADDILVGGGGKDKLRAGRGNDLLIAGSTVNETNLLALDSAYAAWQTGFMQATLDQLGAILDDGLVDDLRGEEGADYLFGGLGDLLKE